MDWGDDQDDSWLWDDDEDDGEEGFVADLWEGIVPVNSIIAFHGIGAYTRKKLKRHGQRKSLLEKAITGEVEIAVADLPIGEFGIIVKGGLRVAFECDIKSEIGDNGSRQLSLASIFFNEVVDPTQEEWDGLSALDMKLYMSDAKEDGPIAAYSEGWMKTTTLVAVWIDYWAEGSVRKSAMLLAEEHGVPLVYVNKYTKIRELGLGGKED